MPIDRESALELMDALRDLQQEIRPILQRLQQTRTEPEDLNALFRAIHSIKGNAGMLQLHPIVELTHALEEIAEALRQERLSFHPMLVAVLTRALEQVDALHQRELFGNDQTRGDESAQAAVLTAIARSMPWGLPALCRAYLEASDPLGSRDADLTWFRQLGTQLDQRMRRWSGFSAAREEWVLRLAGKARIVLPVIQVQAAACLLDLAEVLPGDSATIAAWLNRIPGWETTAGIFAPTTDLHREAHCLLKTVDHFLQELPGAPCRTYRAHIARALNSMHEMQDPDLSHWVLALSQKVQELAREGQV